MNSVNKIDEELIAITRNLLVESGGEFSQRHINMETSIQRHLGIDSLGRAELFTRIERHFGVQLSQQLLMEVETLKDIRDAILSNTPAKNMHQTATVHALPANKNLDVSDCQTLMEVLRLYATQVPERQHIFLQDEFGNEEILTYGKLYKTALNVAAALVQRGLQSGDAVAIMQPTHLEFFYSFYGVLLAGGLPVPIYPPFRPHQIEAYAQHEATILRNAEAWMLITFDQAENLSKLLRAFVPSLKEVVTVADLLASQANEIAPYIGKPEDNALIQYTSGSTSSPKGVLLTHQNLLANIRAYGQAIQLVPTDVAVSWTPLYHDLGLIGMWFGSLYHSIPLVIMSPLTFLARPEKWLWAMHYHRGTISGGPNFAYELCVRKIDPAYIEGLDLSSWRLAFNGAEPIQPKTLDRFTQMFAPYGFKASAHFPVYGLAESAVCVATPPLNRGALIDSIDRYAFEVTRIAMPSQDKNALQFVACGRAIPNHEMRVVDDNNTVLAEREIGRLQFRGPSSMQGYFNNPQATRAVYHEGGWWDTGDFAYLADQEVYITGRMKDLIIKGGRNLYPAEIEELVGQIKAIRKGCVIAFGVTDPQKGTEKLIVVAETRDKNPAEKETIIADINTAIADTLEMAPDQVVLVKPYTIPKTSSGKLQRNACKNAYLKGELFKKTASTSWQIFKLTLNYVKTSVRNFMSVSFKFLFTIYVAILMAITLFPIWLCIWILPKDKLAPLFHLWARFFSYICFCPISIKNKEYLYQQRPVIYAANHTSYVDALFVLAILPADTLFTAKTELTRIPVIRSFFKKLGHIIIDRRDILQSIEDSKAIADALNQGRSIVIFPEGTFSYAVGLRPFKLGAFKVAVETGRPICPVAITGVREILRGEEKLLRPNAVKVTVGEPILPDGKTWQDMMRLKQKVREHLAKYCGEPALDFLTTQIALPRAKHPPL